MMTYKLLKTINVALVAIIAILSMPLNAQSTLQLPHNGLNVAWTDFSYFTSALPFTNAMKHSSGFIGNGLTLDENGYVISMPNGEQAVNYIFLETTHYPTGNYTLQWEGEGDMIIQTCGNTYFFEAGDNTTQTISITNNCENGIILTLTDTNPSNYVRNLRLYLPGYDETSGYWTTNYINYFAQFEVARFAWGSGMYSLMTNWSERKQINDLTWAAGDVTAEGVPYEAMVELANAANTDLWVCVPAYANANFELAMATLLRDGLNQNHKVWIEWANEQWNCGYYGYAGCEYLCALSNNCGDNQDPNYQGPTAPELYAQEVISTTDNFISVFSSTGERDRLINVLGGQQSNWWQLDMAAQEIANNNKMGNIDVMSQGLYFNQHEDYDPLTPVLDQGMDAIMDAVELTMEDLFEPTSTMGIEIQNNITVANTYNKPMVIYEGGQHFTEWVGVTGQLVEDINNHPRMYDIYTEFLQLYDNLNLGTMIHYSSYGEYWRGEAFGLQEYYDQPLSESHKLRAILDWQNSSLSNPDFTANPTATIYPNPANDYITIEIPEQFSDEFELVLYDIRGRVCLRRTITRTQNQSLVLDISQESTGLYMLKFTSQDMSFTSKLLIR